MSSVARGPRVRSLAWARPSIAGRAVGALGLGALLLLSLFLRTRALDASLWIDEGLSAGVSSHSLTDIPELLRQDGSPPLYYLALHVWTAAFGKSPEALRGLSLMAAMLTVPAALWAGWSLFGQRVGRLSAGLFALNPFLVIYGQETRMYALVVLWSLLATATFLHAFVYRRRRYVPAFGVLLALLLYTHNWGLFFGVGAGAAFLVCLRLSGERRRLLIDGALAFGGAALLYAPWLPTLAFQAAHTGAPWAQAPTYRAAEQVTEVLLGDPHAVTALLLVAAAGALAALRAPRDRPERTALIAGLVLVAVTMAVAFLFSKVTPAWSTRYFAVFLGPVLLLAALGAGRAGRIGLAGAAVALLVWAIPASIKPDYKSNAQRVAAKINPELRPGDLVLATQPEAVPLLAYYLPDGMRYASTLGRVPDPRIMDWRDGMKRLRASSVDGTLTPLLDAVPMGGHVLLARPFTTNHSQWKAPWTKLVRKQSSQWSRALGKDPRFAVVQRAQAHSKGVWTPMRAVLYVKRTP